MNTLHGWPSSLLKSANLTTPDGRPLYAYRCTNERFEEVRGLLAGWSPLRDAAGGRAFAVYAAEWWRRNYPGGPWAWQPLLDSIRCDVAFPELYRPLKNAWRWWGVNPVVLGASVRYLGTCACQGGLPLHFVSSPNSNVRHFLRALLREYRAFRRVVDDGYMLAEPLRSYLPRSLRQEPVYRLCADVMDQIWELRGIGSEADDPVAILDRQRPDWRSHMPIDIEDEQARALIVSLLRDAAKVTSAATGEFRVHRYIADTSAGRQFIVEPRVPKRMSAAEMARLVGVRELPRRFQLRIDGTAPLPIADGRLAGDDVVFSGVRTEPEHLAALADQEIRCFLQAGRRIGDSFAPRGSAAPADELPWVFAAMEDDTRFDLYAEGSVRTRHPRVAVACRDDAAAMLRSHPGCRPWTDQPVAGRVVFDVEGDLTIETSIGTCRMRTAQEREQQFEHRLTGARCLDFDAPLPVYRRPPSIRTIEPDGAQRGVPAAQVSWRAARGDRWIGSPDEPGVWRVRREVEGETVFLSRICLVGVDFGVKIVPGRNPRQGFVDISGTPLDVTCEQPLVDIQTAKRAAGMRVTVSFFAERAAEAVGGRRDPPSHVVLATRWPNGSTLPVTVPFPGSGARFAHPTRAEADRRRGLSVQSLYGWRALAVSSKSSHAFRLVGELRADDFDGRMAGAASFDVELPKTADGVSELPLIEVHDTLESLFAATKSLDARIDLELMSGGFTKARTAVRRFACDVQMSDTGVYRVPTQRVPDDEASVWFEAFSLEKPGLGRTPLERVREAGRVAGWKIPTATFSRQTRIVLARSGDQHFARPFVDSSGRMPLDAAEVRSLADAASIPDTESRIASMRRILENMIERGEDENWDYLVDLLDVSRGLAATTFDALDCLSDSPRTLVQLLLRSPQDEARARIWRLESELPFTWLLVPVAVWREEMTRAHRAIRAELGQIDVLAAGEVRQRAAAPLRHVAAEAARFCPAWGGRHVTEAGGRRVTLLEHLAEDAIFGCPASPEASLTPPARRVFDALYRADGPYQALLQRGGDFRWPSGPDRDDWAEEVALLNEVAWKDMIWADCRGVGFRRPLSDAPFGAAFAAASGVRVSRRLAHATKLLRSHAPEWFDSAYAAALSWILGIDRCAPNHD